MTSHHDPETDPTPPTDETPEVQDDAIPFEPEQEVGELSELQRKHDELEERLLRVSADYQNYVRRAGQNAEQQARQKVISVAKALAPAIDHFDRALDVDPEKTSAEDLLQGVTSIRDELLKALSGVGIERIHAEPGDEFDPNRHEALMRQPHDDFDEGQVVQQLQPGYAVGEAVIRAAQVVVAG